MLGIRHHGPGSAPRGESRSRNHRSRRRVYRRRAGARFDCLTRADTTMRPPVAGLVYAVDQPHLAAYYPFAAFSPEWIALRWALANDRAVRFIDLASTNDLAREDRDGGPSGPSPDGVREDPIAALAAAAGYDDAERWWDDAIEQRYHDVSVFNVIRDAMELLRADRSDDEHNARREAAMRTTLRAIIRDEPGTVAVVCGAWHAPVLEPDAFPSAASDNALLRGLPKIKVATTWVPWTSGRLSYRSGYGAGVVSPGWYAHLYEHDDDVVGRWMVRTARCLRDEQHDASSATAIEAVRLAEALATIRDGLSRVSPRCWTRPEPRSAADPTWRYNSSAANCWSATTWGASPTPLPWSPWPTNLAREQKRLRLKPSAQQATLELDLRTQSHLDRSQLFHRLALLDVPWAVPAESGRTRGTFKEVWSLEWRPELEITLIEAGAAGTTIVAAATANVRRAAANADDLSALTTLMEGSLLADLPDALADVMEIMRQRAAMQHDITRLMAAIEPLARIRRYGNVRRSDTAVAQELLHGLVTRRRDRPCGCVLVPRRRRGGRDAGARRAGARRSGHGERPGTARPVGGRTLAVDRSAGSARIRRGPRNPLDARRRSNRHGRRSPPPVARAVAWYRPDRRRRVVRCVHRRRRLSAPARSRAPGGGRRLARRSNRRHVRRLAAARSARVLGVSRRRTTADRRAGAARRERRADRARPGRPHRRGAGASALPLVLSILGLANDE